MAIVVLLGTNKGFHTHTTLASSIVSLCTTAAFAAVSDLDHVRSLRPSILTQAYFFFSIFCDIPRIRTQWMLPDNATVAPIFSATFGLKVLLIFIESVHKYSHSTFAGEKISPEVVQGLFGDTFFTWLNPLFFEGYKRNLTMDDLYPIDKGLAGETLYDRLNSHWLKGWSTRPVSSGNHHRDFMY